MGERDDTARETVESRVERVRRLLRNLDRRTVSRLFDAVAPDPRDGGARPAHVGAALLEVLNGRRRAHARRLWTRWVEPVMLRDAVTLAHPQPTPGCIHFIDTAGWWAALSRRMAPLVAEIQDTAAARAQRMPLDAVLASPDAARWTEDLRRGSLSELDALRDSPIARCAVLAEVNAERQRLAAGIDLRLLGDGDLMAFRAMLESPPGLNA
ncbi:hypothetical protein [Azospirillum sp.]|uniref:hypothetical protein n=1 Tax=Azospirillum sp. TaxID=34012 RepID=UPI002D6545CB|nr:hypothetical protein [Azospirillum sp.]HYD70364.1 hypothetical protein [Azospirillum sp.]